MPAAAVLAPSATVQHVCDDITCINAYSHRDTCRCSCGGDGHGLSYQAQAARGRDAMKARINRNGGNPFHNLPAIDDEEW